MSVTYHFRHVIQTTHYAFGMDNATPMDENFYWNDLSNIGYRVQQIFTVSNYRVNTLIPITHIRWVEHGSENFMILIFCCWLCYSLLYLVWVWIRVSKPTFVFFFFKDQRLVHCTYDMNIFFFQNPWDMNIAPRHMNSKKKKEWTVLFHTFKNYFATVFSVFSKISCIQTDHLI